MRAAATGGAAQRIGECRVTLPIMIVKEKTEERERYVAGQRLQRAKKKDCNEYNMRYDDDERRYYKLRNELPSKLVFYSPLATTLFDIIDVAH